MRRNFATTSCDVQPAGLSTTTSPSVATSSTTIATTTGSERGDDARDHLLGRRIRREPGGEAMSTAALALRDAPHVDVAERAQADAPRVVGGLLEHARDIGF